MSNHIFEDAYKNLKPCHDHVQESVSEGKLLDLSRTEIAYYRLLVKMCNDVIGLDQELEKLADDLENVGITFEPTQEEFEDMSLIDMCRSLSEMKL